MKPMPEHLRRLFDPNDTFVRDIYDMTHPRLTYSLESLPYLLGAGDLIVLKHALRNAIGDADVSTKRAGENEGDYIARMVRYASQFRTAARPDIEAAPLRFEGVGI